MYQMTADTNGYQMTLSLFFYFNLYLSK